MHCSLSYNNSASFLPFFHTPGGFIDTVLEVKLGADCSVVTLQMNFILDRDRDAV